MKLDMNLRAENHSFSALIIWRR